VPARCRVLSPGDDGIPRPLYESYCEKCEREVAVTLPIRGTHASIA
jgi:hypothetical protein